MRGCELGCLLFDAGIAVTGPGVAHYEDADVGRGAIKVHAADRHHG